MDAREESDRLHARVRAIIGAFDTQQAAPEDFDALAGDIARFQARCVPGYARLCAARGVDPSRITRAAQAPAVPTEAFRWSSVFAFAPKEARAVFRTSGTTHGERGVHRMRTTSTYDAAALAFGRRAVGCDLPARITVLGLTPSEEDAPDSSLVRMCASFARAWGDGASAAETFFVRAGEIDLAGLRARVGSLPATQPALLLATTFALVHVLDACAGRTIALPPHSRVMQTGGFKGKSREVAAEEVRRGVARLFGVEERAVVAEYGMTELSSQFWEATFASPGAAYGVYSEPPWARVVPVDPETLAPVRVGEVGIARIEDLANVDSAFAVLTQDRVRRSGSGFELLGRAPGAVPRGCSLALEEMLSARRP